MMKRSHIIALLIVVILLVKALVLFGLGHSLICPCGTLKIWDGVVRGAENSQHLLDWYSFSHLIWGAGFYFVLWIFLRKRPLPWGTWLLLVVIASASWEIFENTHYAIDRFHQNTIYGNYYGDSIVNSLMDTAAMAFGFWLAWRLPVLITILLVIGLEIITGYAIRDNFILGVIMFVHPFAAILGWQGG